MHAATMPNAINYIDHDSLQHLPRRSGFATVLCQELVEQDNIGCHLPDLGTLRVIAISSA